MSYSLTNIGCGAAFSSLLYGQTNWILTAPTGKRMLIDPGQSAVYFARDVMGFTHLDFDTVYVSHGHADHIGSMEWLSLMNFFMPRQDKTKTNLVCEAQLMEQLWEHALKLGLETLEKKVAIIDDFFTCQPVHDINKPIYWEGLKIEVIQTLHIMSGRKFQPSYGMIISEIPSDNGVEGVEPYKVFLTTDTQYCPEQLAAFYDDCDFVIHDVESAPFSSGVHAHWDKMKHEAKKRPGKLCPVHCNYSTEDIVPVMPRDSWEEDGFVMPVRRGEVFTFDGADYIRDLPQYKRQHHVLNPQFSGNSKKDIITQTKFLYGENNVKTNSKGELVISLENS